MTDIVKMLRECSSDEAYLSRQAADEIARLRAEVEKLKADIAYADMLWGTAWENEKLRAALARIENEGDGTENVFVLRRDIRRARAALEEKQ